MEWKNLLLEAMLQRSILMKQATMSKSVGQTVENHWLPYFSVCNIFLIHEFSFIFQCKLWFSLMALEVFLWPDPSKSFIHHCFIHKWSECPHHAVVLKNFWGQIKPQGINYLLLFKQPQRSQFQHRETVCKKYRGEVEESKAMANYLHTQVLFKHADYACHHCYIVRHV
jgi:hypothetical protein